MGHTPVNVVICQDAEIRAHSLGAATRIGISGVHDLSQDPMPRGNTRNHVLSGRGGEFGRHEPDKIAESTRSSSVLRAISIGRQLTNRAPGTVAMHPNQIPPAASRPSPTAGDVDRD